MIDFKELKQEIDQKNPLILNLTNNVTMDFIANALLAIGASPVMSNELSDAVELSNLAQGITINIGTANKEFMDISLAVAQHNIKKKPLILDPVGSGASTIRTQSSLTLLPYCTGIRGNASEIKSLIQTSHQTKGVDACIHTDESVVQAQQITKEYSITTSISGKIDVIIDHSNLYRCCFGHEYMSKITGMGCVLSAVITVFNCVIPNPTLASYYAHLYYGLCGELAYKNAKSLGFFKNYFIDMLHQPDFDYIHKQVQNI